MSDAPSFFSLGVRAGFNTSNRTFPSEAYSLWTNNSWGTGVNLGVVANLNFKEFLSVQPGIFYESRSGNYAYLTQYIDNSNKANTYYEMGHWRGYFFTIPVMVVGKLNLAENIKCLLELGPYFQFKIGSTGLNNINVLYRLPQSNDYDSYVATPSSFDIGLKLGTGLKFFSHYYIGVHYMAGFSNTWKNPAGGKNKSWQFSLGYDF